MNDARRPCSSFAGEWGHFLLGLICVGMCLISGCSPTRKNVLPSTQVAQGALPSGLPIDKIPFLEDDYDPATLLRALDSSISYYERLPADQLVYLESLPITVAHMRETLHSFYELVKDTTAWENRHTLIPQQFELYAPKGIPKTDGVTFSSYYEPTVSGRLTPDATYQYPFYGRPDDLIEVPLEAYDDKYRGQTLWGRVENGRLTPYFTREEIDSQNRLQGRNLEIAWTNDPMQIFFMQIEGSGWLDLGNGEKVRIRYAANNGRKYKSVGQTLLASGRLGDKKHISHAEFHEYVGKSPERQSILNVNPRYIFFQIDRSTESFQTYGNINVPLTPGRSVATDPALFPKGALAWMRTTRPIFNEKGKVIKTGPLKRFILNQDEGGAIKGPTRVDFYVGGGESAEQFATHFWQKGELYFLVKKSSKQVSTKQ